MLKKFLMAGCAFAAIATNAMALTTPEPISSSPNGDPHIVKVEWHDGGMIQLIGSLGQTLAIEMPAGTVVDTFLTSDQDVMDKRPPPPASVGGVAAPAGKTAESANQDNPCSETANVQICIMRSRYVFIKPLTELNPQSLALLMTRKGTAGRTIENVAMFLIETTPHPERVYYSVKVTMPQATPATPAAPAVVAGAGTGTVPQPRRPVAYVPRIPSLAQSQPQPTPAPVNNAYSVEGDRRLLGASR